MGNIQKTKGTMLLSDPSQRLCRGVQFCLRGALKSLLFVDLQFLCEEQQR
jgi:hypothetical protein